MENVKDELRNIILRDEPFGEGNSLKKTQAFLRRHAKTGVCTQKHQYLKSEETKAIIAFAEAQNLFYQEEILESNFISEGAEQRVYRLDESTVIKTNAGIFYEYWLDYFNSVLIHNYFFPSTGYTFLGFKVINGEVFAVVRQEFVVANEATDLDSVKQFLNHNGFQLKKNNDYFNSELGLILEDLHDENVLSNTGVLFFIDTIFYIRPAFYS